ncbi:MAG: DUF4337 family protein, partial [Bacteroidota bacterium]
MLQEKQEGKTVQVSAASQNAEAIGGVLIAFFAALMAISQMVNGELEEEMMIAHNKVVNYSNWYQSKSIKQSLKESELHYLNSLMYLGKATSEEAPEIKEQIKLTESSIKKYKAEKTEILVGS